MANKKITDLTPKGSQIANDDLIEISQYISPGVYSTKSIRGDEIGGGVTTFQALTDAFTFAGNALEVVRVNAGATALESFTLAVSDTNIANTNLTLTSAGATRKLIFGGASTSDVLAFRNSTDTATMFQVRGDGVNFANRFQVSDLPFAPTTNYAMEIRNYVTNAVGFPIAKFTNNLGATTLDIRNSCVGVGTDAQENYALTVRTTGNLEYHYNINSLGVGSVGVFGQNQNGRLGVGNSAYTKIGGTFTHAKSAWVNLSPSTTLVPHLSLEAGVAPTTPQDGDIWFDGSDIKMRIGGVTKTFTLV